MSRTPLALRRSRSRARPDQSLARIEALIRNARSTWFALLGVLAFVGVTLMGVEHIDFWGVDRATQLPLVGVTVPTRLFFYVAPILTAAVYGYFHLYLIRLWDALGSAPTHIEGRPLGDRTPPWLVADAALRIRDHGRRDGSTTHRALEWPAAVLNIALAWGFGPLVLGFAWWLSMAARTPAMTLIAGASVLAALLTGGSSLWMMWQRMRHGNERPGLDWSSAPGPIFISFAAAALAYASIVLTAGDTEMLAELNMTGEAIVLKPDDWLPHHIAIKEFRAEWCKREDADCTDLSEQQQADFEEEWNVRRAALIAALEKPEFSRPDWRGAVVSGAFLSGADLQFARMEGADLREARMEGADLRGTQMQGANLSQAQMERANLFRARMRGATLRRAQLDGADLRGAQMERADLRDAIIKGANLRAANLVRADLSGVHMEGADLGFAHMEWAKLLEGQMKGAILLAARMKGADLRKAQMQEVNLTGALMEATDLENAVMERAIIRYSLIIGRNWEQPDLMRLTNLRASVLDGSALRSVDLRLIGFDAATDFRNAFLDSSVALPSGFREQMGNPCQWSDEPLGDSAFFGRWRGWIEASPHIFSYLPDAAREYPAIPPPEGCEWKSGPMPGAEVAGDGEP